ncbi:hypothetical protein Y032_0004g1733 [Ancylostoma ceylanicum]|uniref:Uncharacterized protein n=1 Tax=Ancylostoma ceylanicum TaxID=53326 RepID=A0A016VTS7_9BILA|nr:hypothetical protein Y032_0004g1733 [Ancylostoma ceylanicum]
MFHHTCIDVVEVVVGPDICHTVLSQMLITTAPHRGIPSLFECISNLFPNFYAYLFNFPSFYAYLFNMLLFNSIL